MAIRQPKNRPAPPRRPSWQSRYHGVRMTPEEYLALPEEKPYLEYVDGMVIQKPMPTEEHGILALELGARLREWARPRKGRVGVEALMRQGDLPNYRLPDVSYWDAAVPRGADAPPTVAIEIRSPDQTLAELHAKCRSLLAAGVAECWLLDPGSRTAFVFDAGRDGEPVNALESPRLPGFSLLLDDLFAALED